MAGLNTLRTKGGLFLTIFIGGALLMFIISLAFENGGMGGQDPKVAEINGEKITYTHYQDTFDAVQNNLSTMSGQDYSSSEAQDAVHNVTWQQLLNQYAIEPGFAKMGIDVSDEERIELISGQYVSPIIVSAFTNPQTGMFSPEEVVNYLNAAAADQQYGPLMMQRYEMLVHDAQVQRAMEKFVGLVSKGVFVNDLEVAAGVTAANKAFTGRWVGQNYMQVADSLVKVEKADVEKYYNENKKSYKQMPSRSISYVVFEVEPTENDRLAAANEVEKIAAEFAATDEPLIYAKSKSRETVDEAYYSKEALSAEMAAIAFGKDRNQVYGPVLENDVYHISRVTDVRSMPDSVGVSYIVLAQNAAKADSLMAAAKGGADFAAMAMEFSEDRATAELGGELGTLPYSAYPEEFRAEIDNASKGSIFKVDMGQVVYVVRLDRKDAPVMKAQVATISYPIMASPSTEKDIHSIANQFSVAAQGSVEKFNAAAAENAVVPRVARIMNSDRQIAGMSDDSRSIVRWAFDAEVGEVSEIYTVDRDYVVAIVTEKRDEKYATLQQVYNEVYPMVVNQKKFELLKSKLAGKSLEEAAAELGVEVGTFENVTANGFYIDGIGVAPRTIGAISQAAEGQLSQPINDITGAYVFVVDQVVEAENQTAEKEQVRQQAMAEAQAAQRMNQALYEGSEIEDLRVKFF
ncbi:MAG: SurA N-terminal domain-containing protein [Rikenellaceae bacterium]|nr:SurA N-terminal domain-containing protein [Rikenellaceae bacterium]MBR3801131.1 SurA N-terminal domain-containing protein [Rikenellaceae bacterium]